MLTASCVLIVCPLTESLLYELPYLITMPSFEDSSVYLACNDSANRRPVGRLFLDPKMVTMVSPHFINVSFYFGYKYFLLHK